jgi:hypothetical protein
LGPVINRDTYTGGIHIESEYDKDFGGTLGCFAFTREPSPKAVLLTNQHTMLPVGKTTFKGGEVGPKICTCCSSCCSTVIAVLHQAVLSETVDASIALLRSGTKIVHEIPGIGVIKGIRPLVPADAVNKLPVQMFSSVQKRVVTGVVDKFDYTGNAIDPNTGQIIRLAKDQIGIAGDAATPGFGDGGDSGSVVLDMNNMVVGLLYGGAYLPDGTPVGATACHIVPVQDALKIDIAKATAPNQVFTVPSGAGIPSAGNPLLNFPLTGGMTMDIYEKKINELNDIITSSPLGEYYKHLFLKHRTEIRSLVNTNKKVATTWHRNKGPAFLNFFYQDILREDFVFRKEIESITLSSLLLAMAAILKKYGSDSLRKDLEMHLDEVLQFEMECNTKQELLTKLAKPTPQCPAA